LPGYTAALTAVSTH
jgi:hypothetical protein